MILFKEGVRIKVFSPVILRILSKLEEFHILRDDLCPKSVTVTSINDSEHSATSKHYSDEAIDLRSKNFEPWKKSMFLLEFSKVLNYNTQNKYTVLLENLGTDNEHFHVQLAKGTKYNA